MYILPGAYTKHSFRTQTSRNMASGLTVYGRSRQGISLTVILTSPAPLRGLNGYTLIITTEGEGDRRLRIMNILPGAHNGSWKGTNCSKEGKMHRCCIYHIRIITPATYINPETSVDYNYHEDTDVCSRGPACCYAAEMVHA